jgi:hypothetical protein
MQKTRTMKSVFRRGLTAGLLTAGLLAGQWTNGAEAPERQEHIRGFGEVRMSAKTGAGAVFNCESPERATVLLHKIGRDLSQSATEPATWQMVKLGDVSAPVLVRPGLGSFLPTAKGNVVTVYTAPDGQAPETAFAKIAPELDGARFFDKDFRYPVYLDKFSHAGIGSWYPSNWTQGYEGKPNTVDDHFAFARELDLALQPNAGGFQLRNLLPKIREYGRPYHFAEWQEWSADLAIMAPEDLITTGPDFSVAPGYYGQVSYGGKRLQGWRNWMLQEKVRGFLNDPLLVDWTDPNGEVGPFPFHDVWDFSENNRKHFVRFLQNVRGYDLKTLGLAWHGNAKVFKSWDEVPIPMTYDFFGWTQDSLMANRDWRIHPVAAGRALEDGIKAGYCREDFNDAGWVTQPLPGGEMIEMFNRAKSGLWLRGTLEVPAKWLADQRKAADAKPGSKIYLTAATLTSGRFMGASFGAVQSLANADRVWLNGEELGAFTGQGGSQLSAQFDVTDRLRPGRNTIAYLPADPNFGLHGSFFLTDQPLENYPFTDAHRNARYSDWKEYLPWAVADMLEDSYKAIRAVDLDRFIKTQAFHSMDLSITLGARYGTYGHNTGDEAFFRPWDRRFGYVRGVPASAEPSGSVESPEHYKRWLGWHSFTAGGPSALDYFHNIQSMMYSPAAPLWREYMPYWKLSARRELKKPDIALFWSSRNNTLLKKGAVYQFDLGRGDLQALGYSYVYVDETTVRDGLIKDYPVIWDSGTWVMDAKTVEGLKEYVEAGGTYVAIQETGRHTTTQKDAWPISELTGFKVVAERPMSGTLSILSKQPLFSKLAGRVVYNSGKSVDFSGYNFADKSFALKPVAKDTEVIARYADGAAAIGLRKLGKGRVIVLGSPFWRDSYDRQGMWWPGEGQSQFLEDLFAGLGLKPLAPADTHKVWREHYLAINGTEEFLYLHNPTDEAVTFSTDWTAVNPVGKLFDPKNGKEIPGKIDGRNVRLEKLTLAPRETLIVATQPRRDPELALADWFHSLARYWRPSEGGKILERPDLPLYEVRLADKLLGKVLTSAEAAALPAIPAGTELGACQSPEAFKAKPDKDRRCVFHVNFVSSPQWRPADHVTLDIRAVTYAVGNLVGPVDAWLNGEKVFNQADAGDAGKETGAQADIGKLLKPTGEKNVLVFTTGPLGFYGDVSVRMRPAPTEVIEVAGTWQMQKDPDSGLSPVTLPGEMNGMFAATTVTIPAAWKGDRVFVALDLSGSYSAFAINEKMIFHPQMWPNLPVRYMDVTPWVKFGEANRLTLITAAAASGWQPGKLDVKKVSIQRVKLGKATK